jgi:hypothetical protein
MEIAYARGREWSVFMEVAKWTVIDAVVVVKGRYCTLALEKEGFGLRW